MSVCHVCHRHSANNGPLRDGGREQELQRSFSCKTLEANETCLGDYTHMTSAIFSDFWTPTLLVGRIRQLIYSIKFTQPRLLHLLFGYPPPSTTTDIICVCSLAFIPLPKNLSSECTSAKPHSIFSKVRDRSRIIDIPRGEKRPSNCGSSALSLSLILIMVGIAKVAIGEER